MTKLIQGDALAVLRGMETASFDACLTDPPYGLSFMGAAWDHGVPAAATWAEVLRVLKPGGHMLAFGGSRTHHRLMCAIEDAGFEIRDCLMWLHGSGFPKAKSCLKPAWEPIILARKRGRVLPLNIDACRIGTDGGWKVASESGKRKSVSTYGDGLNVGSAVPVPNLGRWPANLLLDEEAAAALDAQSGILTSGGYPESRNSDKFKNTFRVIKGGKVSPKLFGKSSGGASRFFYCAKASPPERGAANNHPCVKPLKLIEHLAKLILPPNPEARLLVPFSGSGSEILGARSAGWQHIIGIEQSAEYVAIAEARLAA